MSKKLSGGRRCNGWSYSGRVAFGAPFWERRDGSSLRAGAGARGLQVFPEEGVGRGGVHAVGFVPAEAGAERHAWGSEAVVARLRVGEVRGRRVYVEGIVGRSSLQRSITCQPGRVWSAVAFGEHRGRSSLRAGGARGLRGDPRERCAVGRRRRGRVRARRGGGTRCGFWGVLRGEPESGRRRVWVTRLDYRFFSKNMSG
jgi:hypothetical protein